MSARAIAIHGNEMSGERRANLEIKSECPALPKCGRTFCVLVDLFLFRFNQNTETRCFGMEPKQTFFFDSFETSFGSIFGCFESKLVLLDTLVSGDNKITIFICVYCM